MEEDNYSLQPDIPLENRDEMPNSSLDNNPGNISSKPNIDTQVEVQDYNAHKMTQKTYLILMLQFCQEELVGNL